MRIITGRHKGRRLKTLEGSELRPTSDRLRETVFNIIGARVREKHLLDLCAGSGAIGIEALSRGAAKVTFIEHSRRAHQVISDNLKHCEISRDVQVVNRDALTALKYFAAHNIRFDIVYFDPPYDSGLYSPVLSLLGTRELINQDGIVIAEHRSNIRLSETSGRLTLYRTVKQGDSTLSFYHLAEAEEKNEQSEELSDQTL